MAKSPNQLASGLTLQERMIDFLTNSWQPMLAVAILLLLVFGGIVTYNAIERSAEKRAQEKLYALHKAMQNETAALESAEQAQLGAKKSSKTKSSTSKTAAAEAREAMSKLPPKTPQLLAKNYNGVLQKYVAFIHKYKNRKASYIAAIQAASLSEQYNDYSRAEKFLKLVVNRPGKKDLFWGLLKGQYAGVLIRENKCGDAIPVLKEIANNSTYGFFQAHALLRLGACYIETKRYGDAEDALVRIQTDFPRSAAAFEARNLKRLILLRSGQKS